MEAVGRRFQVKGMPEQPTYAKMIKKCNSGVKCINSTAEAAYPAPACFEPGSNQVHEPVAAYKF